MRGMIERVEAIGRMRLLRDREGVKLAITIPRSGSRTKRDLRHRCVSPDSCGCRRGSVMVLGALAALLDMEADLSVVAQARDGLEGDRGCSDA